MVIRTRNPETPPLFLLPLMSGCSFRPRSPNRSWRVCPGPRWRAFFPVSVAQSRWDSLEVERGHLLNSSDSFLRDLSPEAGRRRENISAIKDIKHDLNIK